VDETGQPSGAVPTNHNGTADRGDDIRHGGWGPPPAMQPVPSRNGSDPSGLRREPAWSSAGAALEPGMDPLSANWPGAAVFGHPSYQDVGTPVAVGAARAVSADTMIPQPPGGHQPPPAPAASPGPAAPVAPVPPPPPVAQVPQAPPVAAAPPARPADGTRPNGRATAYPASAPPYPYEGDLDGTDSTTAQFETWNTRQGAPLPPGHVGFGEATPPRGYPTVTERPVLDRPATEWRALERPAERQATERVAPERVATDWPAAEPAPAPPEPDPAPVADEVDRAEILPQRVPAAPDVPAVPEPVTDEVGPAEAAELARIAARLKYDAPAAPPREGFDVDAVLAAVKQVPGVRDAHLRRNRDGSGVHTLRLDLADGADPGQVSRLVARLLGEKMGLTAALGPPVDSVPSVPPAAGEPRIYRAAKTVQGTAPVPDTAYQARRRHPTTGSRSRPAYDDPGPSHPVPRHDAEPPAVAHRLPSDEHGLAPATSQATYLGTGVRPAITGDLPSRPLPPPVDNPRVVLDHVQVSTYGLDATVEVRLGLGHRRTLGEANGPAVDGYVLRLCAVAAGSAIDHLLVDEVTGTSRGRCFVEHAAVVPFGSCEVAVAVVLLVCNGWVEQLAGSALVAGDPRQSVVRATLAAVNRRLESLLP
jgi:hypothetical protein